MEKWLLTPFLLPLFFLKNLTVLDLRDTQITDAGVAYLADLKGLLSLQLQGTQVTNEGLSRLKEAIPEVDFRPWGE